MAAAPLATSSYFDSADRLYPAICYDASNALWNSNLKEAEELLSPHHITRPREALEYAIVHVNKTFITSAKEDKEEVLRRLEKAEEIAYQYINDPARLSALFSKTATTDEKYNVLLDCRWVRGPLNLRSAWLAYSALHKESQEKSKVVHREIFDGIRYGMGIFYFACSFAPGMLKSMLELIGFVANRDLGLQYFRSVYDNAGLRAPMTAMFLSLNYLMIPRGLTRLEDMVAAAEPIISHQVEKYPNGGFYLWIDSLLMLKKGDIRSAIEIIKRAIASAKSISSAPTSYSLNLAAAYFMLRDWAAAAEILHSITAPGTKEFDMKGLCGLQLASAYHMMGQDVKCSETLARVPEMAKGTRFAELVLRKARRAQRGVFLGPFELMYFRRDLHHMKAADLAPHMESLEDTKRKAPSMQKNDEAVYLLCKGAILRGLGSEMESRQAFEALLALESGVADDLWVVPNALQELAEIAYFGGNLDLAEKHLKRCMSYSGYDYQEVIHNRARLSLEQIDKEKKSKATATSP